MVSENGLYNSITLNNSGSITTEGDIHIIPYGNTNNNSIHLKASGDVEISGDYIGQSIITGNLMMSDDYIISNGTIMTPSIETNYYRFKNQTTAASNTMYIGVSEMDMSSYIFNNICLGNTNTNVKFGNNMTIIGGFIEQFGT